MSQTKAEPDAKPPATEAEMMEPMPMRVVWDDSKMVTSFANVVNALATREEMTLLFGTNQSWNAVETKELTVQLSNRIVLTPYAAKRLSVLLAARVKDYEARYGVLAL